MRMLNDVSLVDSTHSKTQPKKSVVYFNEESIKVKTYKGINQWDPGGPVTVDGQPLGYFNHIHPEIITDDDAFFWGYGGSGPDRLSIALIADATGSDEDAAQCFMEFKLRVVSKLPKADWTLTDDQIVFVVSEIKGKR